MVDNSIKRCEYTHNEQQLILDYIIEENAFHVLRGNTFWQKFERSKIVDRTWQSLKEHFRRRLVNMLHTFNLSSKQRNLILSGWENSKVVKHDKSGKRVKRARYVVNEFSDEETIENNISDSSNVSDTTATVQIMHPKGKQFKKNSTEANKAKSKKSTLSCFSDDEAGPSHRRIGPLLEDDSSNHSSPNLMRGRDTPPMRCSSSSSSDKTPDSLDLILTKSPRASAKRTSIEIDSDSDVEEELTRNPPTNQKNVSIILNSARTNAKSISIGYDSDSDEEKIIKTPPTTRKSFSITVDSDSDTLVDSINSNTSQVSQEGEKIQFSEREDFEILQFIRKNKTFLRNRNDLRAYKLFCELYYKNNPKKTPRQVRRRFLNFIFPNIYKFDQLKLQEKVLIYVDADEEIPDNLKKSLVNVTLNCSQDEDIPVDSPEKTVATKQTQTDIINVYDPNKNEFHCIFCRIQLEDERHLFVSTFEPLPDREKLTMLAKSLKIDSKNVHFVKYIPYDLLNHINSFRTAISNQFADTITHEISEESFMDIDAQTIINELEICVQKVFIDEDDSENTEQINTQQFNPEEEQTSTPHNVIDIKTEPADVQNTIVHNIKKEIEESITYSSPNPSPNLSDHNYSARQVAVKIEADDNENNISQPPNAECESTNSQRLDSSNNEQHTESECERSAEKSASNICSQQLDSTQETVDLGIPINKMLAQTNNVCSTQASEDTFFSAIGSQSQK